MQTLRVSPLAAAAVVMLVKSLVAACRCQATHTLKGAPRLGGIATLRQSNRQKCSDPTICNVRHVPFLHPIWDPWRTGQRSPLRSGGGDMLIL